jgi:hypothetical protein
MAEDGGGEGHGGSDSPAAASEVGGVGGGGEASGMRREVSGDAEDGSESDPARARSKDPFEEIDEEEVQMASLPTPPQFQYLSEERCSKSLQSVAD